jgi:hypothetical protein
MSEQQGGMVMVVKQNTQGHALLSCTVLYYAVLYCIVQHCDVQCCTVP